MWIEDISWIPRIRHWERVLIIQGNRKSKCTIVVISNILFSIQSNDVNLNNIPQVYSEISEIFYTF